MSNDLFKSVLGVYKQSQFALFIKSSTNNFLQMNDQDFSVYLHEYIHFLQDTSTCYGMIAANTNQLILTLAIQNLRNKIPLTKTLYELKNHEGLSKLVFTFNSSVGMSEPRYFTKHTFKEIEIDINSVTIEGGHINFTLRHPNGNNEIFSFGALCIIESMAYEIEHEIFGDSPFGETSRFPYKIARDFCDKYLHKTIPTKDFISICEEALMSAIPAVSFLSILNTLLNGKDRKHSTCLKNNKEVKYFEALQETLNGPLGTTMGYIYNGNFRGKIANYINSLYINSINQRKLNDYVIAHLLNEDKTTIKEAIRTMHNTIGAPNIFINDYYIGCNALNKSDTDLGPVLGVMGLMFDNYIKRQKIETACPLLLTCQSGNTPYNVNKNCKINFYKNSRPTQKNEQNQDIYCPAGAAVKSLGLDLIGDFIEQSSGDQMS